MARVTKVLTKKTNVKLVSDGFFLSNPRYTLALAQRSALVGHGWGKLRDSNGNVLYVGMFSNGEPSGEADICIHPVAWTQRLGSSRAAASTPL